jgi:glutathione-specific gamma-glutamylcyclotransferase
MTTEEAAEPSAGTPLTREALRDGWIQRMVALGGYRVLTDDELRASLAGALAPHPAGEDLWLFAYGSLIWNPAFRFVERRTGRVHGLHRRFCLWTQLGRGSPDRPGLVLGLDRGGHCRGVLYRVAAAETAAELEIVWRREMVTGAYRPRWVRAETASGAVRALTFVINRAHERYASRLGDEELVRTIATARGALGSCADYLFSTAAHLEQLGIADVALGRLCAEVRAYQLRAAPSAPGPA